MWQRRENDFYFYKIAYNERDMKVLNKVALLTSVFLLTLSSCVGEKKAYVLETSDHIDYVEGTCFQASREDIVDTVFLINLPSKDKDGNDVYDIEWNQSLVKSYFTFTTGLIGKKVIDVFTVENNVLKINFDGRLENPDAREGCIKVSPHAFKAKNEKTRDAYLYAYIVIGDKSGFVDKPLEPAYE